MSNKKFTGEEIEILKKNEYVKNVSTNAITYTNAFREDFAALLENGKKTSEIFAILGFDTKMLGESRIYSTKNRIQKLLDAGECFEDTRKGNSGKNRTKEISKEEEMEQLKHKILLLEQENEFLKKMEFLGKKVFWKKYLQKSDTK